MSRDYSDYQANRDREYAAAWENLSARQRKELARAGVIGPETPVYHTSKNDQEPVLSRASAPDPQPQPTPSPAEELELMDVLRRILGELMAQDNIRLSLECLSLVTGLSYDGRSMTEIARHHGLTRAAVSKRCVEITNALNLPPSRSMRALTARKAYEQRARKCHTQHAH